MGFSLRSFTTITFWFALMVVQSSQELIVLRHPPTDGDSERQLTCVSEDDDAALIWVHNLRSHGSLTDFQPRKPKFKSDTQCAIWDSTDCMARWEYNSKWDVVESSLRPMGPIFDYRWEGFKEFVFEKDLKAEDYQYVGNVNDSSQTTVFSVRGSPDISIFLCANKHPVQGPCLWIILEGGRKRFSAIKSCSKGEPGPSSPDNHCTEIVKVSHGIGDAIQLYEWRTFTLKWISQEKLIQVFRETDSENEPFLQGYLRKWNPISHVSIRSDIGKRIRFHFYQYWLTENENSVLHTTKFNPQAENFCVELLVSLCPECTLNVSLIDTNRGNLETWIIPMEENHRYNELMTWQSIKLSANVSRKKLKLEIQTILNEHASKGQWAIDSFRTCQSVPGLRKSTITIPKEGEGKTAFWPQVNCQKLSYNGSVVVDTGSKHTINNDTHQLEKLVNEWSASCGSSCRSFGEKWSICDSTGCSCSRGFSGSDCENGCTSGYYGYHCAEKCGSCKYRSCDTISGNCANCKDNELLPPLCKEKRVPEVIPDIQDLRAYSPSNTTVELRWKPILPGTRGIVNYHVSIKLDKLIGCEDLGIATPTQPVIRMTVRDANASITGLHPYASYTATVSAYTPTYGKPTTVIFQTLESNTPASKVNNLRIEDGNTTLKWDAPADCTTITGPTKVTKLIFYSVANISNVPSVAENQTSNRYFNLSELKLQAYTLHTVRVYVIRDFNQTTNYSSFQGLRWVTPTAAPPAVKELEIYESDPNTNSISLRWVPPHIPNGELESYQVSIIPKNHILTKQTVWLSELAQDCKKEGNYTCFGRITLQPTAIARDTEIEVRAKNKNVKESGAPSSVSLDPDSHFAVPSQPLNLTATSEAHGIVNLKWKRGFSYIDIKRFVINVTAEETELRENITAKFPKIIHHTIPDYTNRLYLQPSTSYRIYVTAVNTKDSQSSRADVNVSTETEVGFANGDKLHTTQDGTTIVLKIPKVYNATRNTTAEVIVNGSVMCSEPSQATWIADKYEPEEGESKKLTIVGKHVNGVAEDCSLIVGENYEIKVVLSDSNSGDAYTGVLNNRVISSITLTDHKEQNSVWYIVCSIIAICLLVVLFIWHRKRKVVPVQDTYAEILPVSLRKNKSKENLAGSCSRQSSTPPLDNMMERRESNPLYAVPFISDSNSVNKTCFEEYAKESAFNGQLDSQYTMFERGLTKSCQYGRLPQNMPKNRSKNLIAYDDTRVVLDKIPGDPHSDYINANYIGGYGEGGAYIATQGPQSNTINDFWRMIWQKKVLVICMMTNVIEDGKKMCEKYWPEVGTEANYGRITVFNTDHEVFADYTFRTFQLRYEQETRKIVHLHYTAWKNYEIPISPQSLVTYLKRLAEILGGRGPVVVHCSEGNGRTGTIILCDMCVRQGIMGQEIDVPAVTEKMYDSRANMLDSPQQYILAHVIIAESIMSIPTGIPCDGVLPSMIKTLRKNLPSHMKRLDNAVWQERALHSLTQSQRPITIRAVNNELPELIPVRPEVQVHYQRYSEFNCESNYINAVSVDGVTMQKQYLASKLPPPSGLPDLWRFVAERNIELIILLQRPDPNDPMFCDIMPGESILVPVPYIQIETETRRNEGELYTIDKLLLRDTSEGNVRSQSVTVLTCSGWGCGREQIPPAVEALVSLWRASEQISGKKNPVLVLCRDGVTGCGLYLALSFLLERMSVANECDVISAVRAVRRSRPEFVQSLEQLEFLYDAAETYADYFQCYANFT